MKKALIISTYAAIALIVMGTLAHAETKPTSPIMVGEVAGATATATPETPIVPATLTARKAAAQADLEAIETQFRLFATRTQVTIDRLSTKGVDTKNAQTELSNTIGALELAKSNLNLFAKIVVTDDMTEEAVAKTDLKPTLVKIQTNLADARTHLIQSLTALKSSITLTITQ